MDILPRCGKIFYSTVDISLKTNMRSLNSVLIDITVISTHDKRQKNHQNPKIVFGSFYLQSQDKKSCKIVEPNTFMISFKSHAILQFTVHCIADIPYPQTISLPLQFTICLSTNLDVFIFELILQELQSTDGNQLYFKIHKLLFFGIRCL